MWKLQELVLLSFEFFARRDDLWGSQPLGLRPASQAGLSARRDLRRLRACRPGRPAQPKGLPHAPIHVAMAPTALFKLSATNSAEFLDLGRSDVAGQGPTPRKARCRTAGLALCAFSFPLRH